jgi:arylformamidase
MAEERFSSFDDAYLEREYSPSSAIGGNYQPYVAGYEQRSAAVREALRSSSMLGIRYGKELRNIIDVFPAPSADGSPAPALIFFHGGYWQESSLRDVSFPAAALNAAGVTYISVGYTLAPKATLTQIVEEARLAVRFIVDNATRFSVDPASVVLGGHSAGAHLAALSVAALSTAAMSVDGATTGETVGEIRTGMPLGLLLISGIYELLPLLRTSINDALSLSGDDLDRLSPLRRLPGCDRAAIVFGDNDTGEFAWQSHMLATNLISDRRGAYFAKIEIPNRNHFDVVFDLADRNSELFGALLKLLQPDRDEC